MLVAEHPLDEKARVTPEHNGTLCDLDTCGFRSACSLLMFCYHYERT